MNTIAVFESINFKFQKKKLQLKLLISTDAQKLKDRSVRKRADLAALVSGLPALITLYSTRILITLPSRKYS